MKIQNMKDSCRCEKKVGLLESIWVGKAVSRRHGRQVPWRR